MNMKRDMRQAMHFLFFVGVQDIDKLIRSLANICVAQQKKNISNIHVPHTQ